MKDIAIVKPELLAPAGSVEMMKAVFNAGADAVYIGGSRFSARAYADNPGTDALRDAIDLAHLHGKKVHMAVNTLFKENEMGELYDYVLPYYTAGVDAVLVQDMGVLSFLRREFPDLPLHASTQMSVTGTAGAALLAELGVRRIVLARELSIDEIRAIREAVDIELEVFIHGALCVCYSGRCLMSSILGGRSGNRGRCAQPCRLPYEIDGDRGYYLSPKDLCNVDHLGRLRDAGVSSFKIEGRMKQPSYAAGVTAIYRKYLDLTDQAPAGGKVRVSEEDRRKLFLLFNRDGFTDGYLKNDKNDMLAVLNRKLKEGSGDAESVHAQMKDLYVHEMEQIPLQGRAVFSTGDPASLTVQYPGGKVTVTGETVQKAATRPLGREELSERLSKTGGEEFCFSKIDIIADDGIFLPVRAVNALRRQALAEVKQEMLRGFRRPVPVREKPDAGMNRTREKQGRGSYIPMDAVVRSKAQLAVCLGGDSIERIYVEYPLLLEEGAENIFNDIRKHGKIPCAALPMRVRIKDHLTAETFTTLAGQGAERFLARDLEGLALLAEAGLKECTDADASLYAMNREAQALIGRYAAEDTVPYELNRSEIVRRNLTHSTLQIYGYLPLMITEQCPYALRHGCAKQNKNALNGYAELTDRKGVDFILKRECAFCYNILYNSLPLSLHNEADAVRNLHPYRLRTVFTVENEQDCANAVRLLDSCFTEGGKTDTVLKKYTKGHFARGVE